MGFGGFGVLTVLGATAGLGGDAALGAADGFGAAALGIDDGFAAADGFGAAFTGFCAGVFLGETDAWGVASIPARTSVVTGVAPFIAAAALAIRAALALGGASRVGAATDRSAASVFKISDPLNLAPFDVGSIKGTAIKGSEILIAAIKGSAIKGSVPLIIKGSVPLIAAARDFDAGAAFSSNLSASAAPGSGADDSARRFLPDVGEAAGAPFGGVPLAALATGGVDFRGGMSVFRAGGRAAPGG